MAMSTGTNLALEGPKTVFQGAQLFSTNFVKTVAKEQPGNLICSPLSANIALSMAANGAAGTTETQFKDVLKLPASKEQTLEGYQNLIDKLNNEKNVTLKLANIIFVRKNVPVKSEYQRVLQTYYRSDIQSVDFDENQEAAKIINTWCKEKTNNLINDIINPNDVGPLTTLLLANAVYFKGKWAKQFDPRETSDCLFHANTGGGKLVPTMHRVGMYKYAELPEYEAKCIELPYAQICLFGFNIYYRKNKEISMVIILPDKIDGLAALIEKLGEVSAECSTRLAETYKREVHVSLPKFKIESTLDLNNTLSQKMGLTEPFSDDANFKGISDIVIPFKIDKVVQKAIIEVNEQGSEAAAVTSDGFAVLGMSISDIFFTADRPFYYTIKHNIAPLFAGFVVNPSGISLRDYINNAMI